MKIKFENNANIIKREMGNKRNKALIATGVKAVSIWQKLITQKQVVDTGRFRNSAEWYADDKKGSVFIGSPVYYAPFLELGTSKQSARPTLKPAIMDYKEDYKQLLEQILKE